MAARRARELAMGDDPMVERDNDKPTVIALREIAEGLVDASILEKKIKPEVVEEAPTNEELIPVVE